MTSCKKQILLNLFCYLLLLILTTTSIFCAFDVSKKYHSMSLRFRESLSMEQVNQSYRYAAQNDLNFWPTFWREDTVICSSILATSQATGITFLGESSLVLSSLPIAGTLPTSLQKDTCALSEMLSWNLFGTVDSTGQKIKINERDVEIVGVFKEDATVALISANGEDATQEWQAVALSDNGTDPINSTRDGAINFASVSGLGTVDTCVSGVAISSVSMGIALLPIIVLVLWLVISAVYRWLKKVPQWRELILFAILMVFALSLPYILGLIPDMFIPTRWSDFNFWSRLAKQIFDYLMEYLRCYPLLVDGQVRVLLLLQLLIFCGTSITLTIIIMQTRFLRNLNT